MLEEIWDLQRQLRDKTRDWVTITVESIAYSTGSHQLHYVILTPDSHIVFYTPEKLKSYLEQELTRCNGS